MSTDIATLGIRVDSSGVRDATGELKILVEVGTKAEKATDSLKDSFGGLKNVIAGIGLSALAKEAIDMADAYSNAQGKLKLVTNGTAELSTVTDKLFESAQRSRVGFEETVGLYSSLARSTKALGTSQADLLQVTETINKALIVSGASAATAEGALTQLGQGFASGTLRGDELNAVLEGTPRLAQAIADGMKITVGELRAVGAEGKLTGETVFNALKSQKDAIENEFARMPTTVAQSFVVLRNEILKFVGETNEASGVTVAISAALGLLAHNLDTVATAVGILGTILVTRYVVGLVAATAGSVTAAAAMTGMATAAEVAGFATAAAGSKMLGFFGGPIGLAVTGLALGVGYFAIESSKAGAVVDDVNKSYEEMRKRLEATKPAADLAAQGSKNAADGAVSAIPGINSLSGSLRALAGQYYATADAAKKARIEMAATALQKAKSNEAAITAQTVGGIQQTQSRNRAAIGRGDFLALDFSPVVANLRNQLSGGRTIREAEEGSQRARSVRLQAEKDLAEALRSPNAPGVSRDGGASAANTAAIKKLTGEVADLKGLRSRATGAEAKRIDKKIASDERKIDLLRTGASSDAINTAVGSGGGSGGGKSTAQTEYESRIKASKQYVEQLEKESGAVGLSAVEQKLYEARLAASKAPTKALAAEIMSAANAWAVRTRATEAATKAQKEWQDRFDDWVKKNQEQKKAGADMVAQIQYETSLRNLNSKELAIAVAKHDMLTKGIVEGTEAYRLYGATILGAAEAQGQLDLQADQASAFADHMRAVNDNTKEVTATFAELFGTGGAGFASLIDGITAYAEASAQAQERIDNARARYGPGSTKALQVEAEEREAATQRELAGYGKVIRGVKGMFNEKSRAYKVMEGIEKAYAAIRLAMALKEIVTEGLLTTTKVAGAGTRMATDAAETASSVSKSGIRAAADGVAAFAKTLASLPFPFNLAAGAAVLAALVAVGVKISGGGGGKSASKAAEKEEIKPTDYTQQESSYSVTKPSVGFGGSSSEGSSSFSSNSVPVAANSNSQTNTFVYHIDAKGAEDPDAVVNRVEGVMQNYQNDTINKAREAVRNDQLNAAQRQVIGGVR